jgi:WD40 repeat protein
MSITLAKAVKQLHPVSPRLKALMRGYLDLHDQGFLVTTSGEIIEPSEGGYYSIQHDASRNTDRVFVPTGQPYVELAIELGNGDIITKGGDGTYRRTRNRKLIKKQVPLEPDEENITSLTVFTNGDILTGDENGFIKRWRSGKPIRAYSKPIQAYSDATSYSEGIEHIFEVNGDVAALYSAPKGYIITLFPTGRPSRSIAIDEEKDGFIDSAIALANGDIITAHSDGMLRRWSMQELRLIGQPTSSKHGRIMTMLALEDNKFLVGGYDGYISLWKAEKDISRMGSARSFQGRVLHLANLKNQKFLSLGADGTSRVWSAGINLESMRSFASGQNEIHHLSALRNGDFITGGEDGSVRRWTGNRPAASNHFLQAGKAKITAVAELLNGDLITGTSSGNIKWWRNSRLLKEGFLSPSPTGNWVHEIVEVGDGNIFISTLSDSLSLWNLNEEVRRLNHHENSLGGIAAMIRLNNGNVVISGNNNRMLNCDGFSRCSLHQAMRDYNPPLRLIELSNGDLVRSDWGGLELFPNGRLDQKAVNIASGMGQANCLTRLSNGEFLSRFSHPAGGASSSFILRWKNQEPVFDDLVVTDSCLVELRNGDLVGAEENGAIARFSLRDTVNALCGHLFSGSVYAKPKENIIVTEAQNTCSKLD